MVIKRSLLLTDIIQDVDLTRCLYSDNNAEENALTEGSDEEEEIICDICEQLLSVEKGSTWYRCTACEDYDLCKSCKNSQEHVEHRTQLHLFHYHGTQADRGCFSCGQFLKVVSDDNVLQVYICSICEDVIICESCVLEGMHRKHKDALKVSTSIEN